MIPVVGIRVDVTSYSEAVGLILKWASAFESRYVCVGNVHMMMEAYDSPMFKDIVYNADLVTPDGMPLVWMMQISGVRKQQRVYGPMLMLHVLEAAVREGVPVGYYGGKSHVLELLVKWSQTKFPGLNVVFVQSPPFRELTPEEDTSIVEDINRSGARILFVGLGCPKQEMWMAEHRGKVNAVMIGVGAAFDFHAGVKPQAPLLLQRLGLEWFFRLLSEPRRLWRRYLYHNPRFIVLAISDLLGIWKT
jgi:N-acetylglucosaminyldiphosphoundecaprenol N-acetyl-beta-D-mannosaminyltransferase